MFFCSLPVFWGRTPTRSQQNSKKVIITSSLGWEGRALWGYPESMAKEQGELHERFMGSTLEISLAVPMLQGEESGARSGVGWLPCPRLRTKNLSINWEGPATFRNNLSEVKHLWLLICLNSVSKFIQPFPFTGLNTCLQFIIHLTEIFCDQAVLIGCLSTMETFFFTSGSI